MALGLCLLLTCMVLMSVITECKDQKQSKDKCSLALKDGGEVITMSDQLYNEARLFPQDVASASSIEDRDSILSPTMIAIPSSESEIVEIIKFANKCGYTISIRSGGHQYSVITMSDQLYNEARLSHQDVAYASSIEDRDRILSPTIITIPLSESEIVGIIKFANKCGYTISIRSGGHQYSGLSSCNQENGKCIQIDMKHFDYIIIDNISSDDDKLITVGSGVHLVDLYQVTQAMDVAVLGGICATVNAGGHYQSSSQSGWSRSLGLGMDYITRVKIITADGEIRNVYKGDDLFWAILGGSPGSWGVVIEYEFEPIKDSDYPHAAYYSYAHFYSKQGFSAFLNAFIDILDNPYYSNNNDLSASFAGTPRLDDPTTSSSVIGTLMSIGLKWTGIDNGDIHSVIPNHPMNKTWHQELVQPFIDIDEMFEETQIRSTDGTTTISKW
eukprot:CAMPEP_0201591760 /NCGR_PEP_ID=MMETSP0190_2-20130828/189835_1 /ASSEMBLY_ACC=CAM_ASM_000263 /TAXON_ID=37353 /ORGANISM="Rosalina sp." /LENGTH=442 /DNA_ID=CAMNT_0048050221 /DNA_START=97 /DNA_END=1422 /DNA_ORIENTATION=+